MLGAHYNVEPGFSLVEWPVLEAYYGGKLECLLEEMAVLEAENGGESEPSTGGYDGDLESPWQRL